MSIRNQLRSVVTLAWFDGFLPNLRSPLNTVNFVISPLTILFFIYLFATPNEAKFAVAGGLVAVIVGSSIILETEAAFIRLVTKLQDMFVASPTPQASYVLGLAIGMLFNGLPGIVLFSVLLSLGAAISPVQGFLIGLAAALTWAAISALGFMISTFARDMRDLWVYSPLLTVLLAFLPPVFYPISKIPENFRFLAYLAPTTYTAQIIQQAAGLVPSTSTDVAWNLVGAFVYTIGLVGLAAALSRWRQK
ncbi:MAG TPA: ABC transporter permease [Thermoplasmata archaeon]|nr:ABC transporter permease [Thermoplasmata archaeon]